MRAPRAAGFVGRERELDRLLALAERGELAIAWIHGPGGVGKTSLLREVERWVRGTGRPTALARLDRVAPSPAAIGAALGEALGAPHARGLAALLARDDAPVILLDALEATPALEAWLADELSGAPRAGGLVIVASRDAPSREWRVPALERRLVRLALGNFDPDECDAYLAQRGVPSERRPALVAFTRGHPLALALASEAPDAPPPTDPASPRPEVLHALLDALVERSLPPARRRALECLAIVPALTQSMLEHLARDDDPLETFRWLQARPYVRASHDGLVVHDLVRDVLVSDMRWRHPEGYAALATRAVEKYAEELGARGASARAPALALAWMFCRQPAVRRTFEKAADELYFDDLRDEDVPALAALVEREDGASARRAWERSLAWQRRASSVARDGSRRARGLWVELVFAPGARPDATGDPALEVIAEALDALRLEPHERGSLQRWQLDVDAGRAIGATISLRVAHDARVLLGTPNLAVRWIAAPSGFKWARVWESRGYVRLDRTFSMDGREHAIWQLDLRGTRVAEYVRAAFVGAGAVPTETLAPRAAPAAPAITVAALRESLAALHDPAAFVRTPLAQLAPARGRDASPRARVARFRAQIERALATMEGTPRGARLKRAIEATYLWPLGDSQERIAEALHLPFRTYRDHLTHGLAELARRLAA
ncbi:MAG: ATP-binding protein [Sandaracinaceae bacterium]|nr:ATP-binding protein [Sandaracinaceae bacterium]